MWSSPGVGVEQKFLGWLLLVLSVLSLPALAFHWFGSAYSPSTKALDIKASKGMAGTTTHVTPQPGSHLILTTLLACLPAVVLRSPPGSCSGLFYTTLGSLGEGSLVCKKANEGGSLTLACPTGVIGQVQAFYGRPDGRCDCPGPQQLEA